MSRVDFNGPHACEVILREPEPTISREVVTVTGGYFPVGAVLSKDGERYGELDIASDDLVVLLYPVDAGGEDKKTTALARNTSVKEDALAYPEGMSDADKKLVNNQLKKQHIIVR